MILGPLQPPWAPKVREPTSFLSFALPSFASLFDCLRRYLYAPRGSFQQSWSLWFSGCLRIFSSYGDEAGSRRPASVSASSSDEPLWVLKFGSRSGVILGPNGGGRLNCSNWWVKMAEWNLEKESLATVTEDSKVGVLHRFNCRGCGQSIMAIALIRESSPFFS
ncbi:hypothetical protein BT93_E2264 [Corymbia citriodora subsp. variegata]|nr:hypothetical protein BT93_E2264 [Corymbia citriodora subsp. variegata]